MALMKAADISMLTSSMLVRRSGPSSSKKAASVLLDLPSPAQMTRPRSWSMTIVR
jgi:hypothetical protein